MKVRLKEGATTTLESISKNKIYDVHIDSMIRRFVFDDNNNRYYYDENIWDVIWPEIEETPKSGTQYICPMDLFGGAVIKGVRYKQCHNQSFYQPDLKTDRAYNMPAEIVETWEKVQEDIFVNGRNIIFKDGGAIINGMLFLKDEIRAMAGLTPETINKIIERLG